VWYLDEIVVAAFAFLGFGGAVFLPLKFGFSSIPPIVVSFLLATGIAALTYRYLGGIQGASVAIGALKLSGAIAALVGIAMLINHTLVSQVQPYQVWEVSGQVTKDAGEPIEPLDVKDFDVEPAWFVHGGPGSFRLTIYSWAALGGGMEFPTLKISHAPYDTYRLDLNPNAVASDLKIVRDGNKITVGRISLHEPTKGYQPPNKMLTPVPYSSEKTPTPSGSPQ